MDKYIIQGRNRLNGEITVSGSKNAALPILAATLMTEESVTLKNIPDLMDIRTMISLLEMLGKKIHEDGPSLIIEETQPDLYEAPYDIVRKMRASIAVMGPLLGRKGKAKISFPGGCAIGPRPIDIHIRGMKALGAEIKIEHGYVWAKSDELTGKRINLMGNFGPTVLGTENVMMAAALSKGKTTIHGAASEPEILDLAEFLNSMGAKITGAGHSIIEIEGVDSLHGCEYRVIPDRIETGTFIAAAGITGGEIRLKDVNINHIEEPLDTFSRAGVEIEIHSENEITVRGNEILPIEVDTLPYPFFPTDLQSQLMAMLSVSNGISIITEKIFPDRFMHAAELNRMGANIKVDGPTAVIKGVDLLSGTAVMASDLRAGAGIVIGALAARGESEILRIYHIDRGYENFEQKLQSLGADIKRTGIQ